MLDDFARGVLRVHVEQGREGEGGTTLSLVVDVVGGLADAGSDGGG